MPSLDLEPEDLDPRAVDWTGLGDRLGAQLGVEPAALPLIAGGVALLVFGRRLYWLAVGGLGAAVAVTLATYLQLPTPEGRLIVALLAAVAGAMLALFAQRLVVSAVGFLTGAGAAAWLTPIAWPDAGLWLLAVVLVAGILGLLVASKLFDVLLVVATSAAGAWLIVGALPQLATHQLVACGVLFLLGILVQTRRPRRRKGRRSRQEPPDEDE